MQESLNLVQSSLAFKHMSYLSFKRGRSLRIRIGIRIKNKMMVEVDLSVWNTYVHNNIHMYLGRCQIC